LDLPCWGAPNCGRVIGRNARQFYYLYEIGALPSVKKVSGMLVSTPRGLLTDIGVLGREP
jgi:hypothetical protein